MIRPRFRFPRLYNIPLTLCLVTSVNDNTPAGPAAGRAARLGTASLLGCALGALSALAVCGDSSLALPAPAPLLCFALRAPIPLEGRDLYLPKALPSI
ncbi:unnamed protein product [Parnassius apollo]|uniref:(apollo) hypothetical protein n=1 Tax=Parnassius apollo TaxID=110799 RepID=A0A8S3X978_PARAO|nr:unnamed protein product [Parnassius apollo]